MYVCLLFIFAFFTRLINLNQSLWLDEATVAKVIKTIPFLQIPFQFSFYDFHPPLYYMFMSLWGHIFGTSEVALRMPSLFFSLIAGWFIYKTAGYWAGVFFLFNPLIIYYSQEARMYMMATAFLSITLYYFIRIIKTIAWRRNEIILFNLFSALAMLTFYGSIFFIVGMILVGGIQKKIFKLKIVKWIPIFVGMTGGLIISLLLLSPLLFQQLHNAKTGLLEVKNWSLVLGKTEIKNVGMIFFKFITGRLSWYPKWSYYLSTGIPTVLIWFFVICEMKKKKLLVFLFFFPLCVGLLISLIMPMMMYFRFLYLIPIMSIFLGMQRQNKRVLVVVVFLLFSFLYLLFPQFHREDWKTMVREINPMQPVYMILPSSDPVSYYNPTLSLFEMREIQSTILPEYIQIIPYVEEIYGYNHNIVLEKKGCIRKTRSEYRGPLILETWKCPSSFIGHTIIRSIREKYENDTCNRKCNSNRPNSSQRSILRNI